MFCHLIKKLITMQQQQQQQQFLKELFNSPLSIVHNPRHNFFHISPHKEYHQELFENITFEVNHQRMFVYYISNNCGFTGKEVLLKLETFAHQLGLKQMILDDCSKIKLQGMELSLFVLSLFKNDHSFYGKMGFSSPEYQNIIERWHNLKHFQINQLQLTMEEKVVISKSKGTDLMTVYQSTNIRDLPILLNIIKNECLIHDTIRMCKCL